MSKIKPLSAERLKPFKFIMDVVEKSMGFVPNSMKTMARIPGIMGSFGSLAAKVNKVIGSYWKLLLLGNGSIQSLTPDS